MRYFTRVLAAFLCLAILVPAQGIRAAASGGDINDAIEYVKEEGIMRGYDNGDFGRNQPITRAEVVKVLMEAGDERTGGAFCFPDVRNEWFARYVCAAQDAGMVKGFADGYFRPEWDVTLAEAAVLVVRQYEGRAATTGGSWYMPSVNTLEDWDAMPSSSHSLHTALTRGEMAYMIWKADLAADGDDDDDEDDEETELEISIEASPETAHPGQEVTFTITIENDGDDDADVDVEVTLDDDLELEEDELDADDADDTSDDSALWEDFEIDEDEEETITIIATLSDDADEGDEPEITVTAGDEEETDTIEVKEDIKPETSLGDPVLFWNEVAMQANADDHSGTYGTPDMAGPGSSSLALAVVHGAIYEAVNSIDRSYEPYIAYVPVKGDASVDAAVAVAAHRTLTATFPKQTKSFDAALQKHLALLPKNAKTSRGLEVGDAAATQILRARLNDGSTTSVPAWVPTNLAGRHRVDPTNPNQPFMGSSWGNVKPFIMQSSSQFRSAPPPALTSKEYADAFNEVKLYGGDGSITPTIRTQEQTNIGLYWAYDGTRKLGTPPRLYNQIARVIVKNKGNTIVQNARLFALIHFAQADAGIGAWETKYFYDVWRPIVGIREADAGTGPTGAGDNNPLTTGDVHWTPLGSPMSNNTLNNFTPPFPAYPSGHATFGAAVFRTIALFYGTDEIPFTFVSEELNGVTTDNKGNVRPYVSRSFSRLSDAARENAQSRIYLGVHWQFDATAGIEMGNKIAEYNFSKALKPVDKD